MGHIPQPLEAGFFIKIKGGKMSKVVKVLVVNADGNGVSQQKVTTYNSNTVHITDKNGLATVVFEDSEDHLYVNGFEAFAGYVSKLSSPATFLTTGDAY